MTRTFTIAVAALAVVLGACSPSKSGNNRDTMTKRQRDSVFGASAIPNAAAVTKAMTAADSLAAASKRIDSAAKPDTTF